MNAPEERRHERRIAIVGLGAMGGSYAMRLAPMGYHLAAIDRDPDAIHYALEQGLIERGIVAGPVDSSLSARGATEIRQVLGSADAIILGLYPDRILPWLRVYRGLFKPGVFVTDMAAVKGSFVADAQQLMPSGCEFIPCHPMAGLEAVGVRNADPAIFDGANFIITPTEANTKAGVAFAQRLGQALGFAAITMLSVEEHDQLVGYASQLPRALAVCLLADAGDHRLPKVAAGSFRYLAGLADLNTELWTEVMLANRPQLTRQITALNDTLADLRRRLANGEREGLRELLERARANSQGFSGEGGE